MLPRIRDKLRGRAVLQSGGEANMARQRQTMVAGVTLERGDWEHRDLLGQGPEP